MPRHPPCALISFTICFSWVLLKYIVVFLPDLILNLKIVSFHLIVFPHILLFNFQDSYFSILFQEQKLTDNLLSINLYSWMVGTSGLEPPTSRLSGVRSNHLSYAPNSMVEMRRIELLTPCLQSRCSPSWATPPTFFLVSSKSNNA